MSFELPDLDTATFADIQTQLVRRIPQFSSRWTDFNASDPGITLVQMLSWLGESLTYQANAIPIETQRNILRWVLGLPVSTAPWPYAQVAASQYDMAFLALKTLLVRMERGASPSADALQAAILGYQQVPYLALSLTDVQALALQTNAMIDARQAQQPAPTPPAHVARADAVVSAEATIVHILPDTADSYVRPGPGNGPVPGRANTVQASVLWRPSADPGAASALNILLAAVTTYLAPRVLLGSAVRVRAAQRTAINVSATLVCPSQVQPAIILDAVIAALTAYFQPVTGGTQGTGWTYGHAPDPQEVLHLIAMVPGVVAVPMFDLDFSPTVRLPGLACLGVDMLLADLPAGPPALVFDGLPRLRSIRLIAERQVS